MYGAPLVGEYLDRGVCREFPVHTAPDGTIWAYSPLLRLNLRWNGGDIESQGPNTGEVLMGRRGLRLAMETAGVVSGGTGLGRVPLTGTPTARGGSRVSVNRLPLSVSGLRSAPHAGGV